MKDKKWVPLIFDSADERKPRYYISKEGKIWASARSHETSGHIAKSTKFPTLHVKYLDGSATGFNYPIHRLVAAVFLDKPKDANTVIHLDYNKSNNHYKNLKWVNKMEAIAHRRNDPNYKPSPIIKAVDMGPFFKELLSLGVPIKLIAKYFNTTTEVVKSKVKP